MDVGNPETNPSALKPDMERSSSPIGGFHGRKNMPLSGQTLVRATDNLNASWPGSSHPLSRTTGQLQREILIFLYFENMSF
jgi:hypothetical protein